MTTLYRPVKITSAEQAEALPEETIAYLLHEDGSTDGIAMRLTQSGGDPRAWQVMGKFALNTHARMLGWTALVPVEAEETQSEGTGWIVPTAFGPKLAGAYLGSPDGTPPKRYTQTTWRTPWEEQS